MDDDDDAQIIM